MMQTGGATAGPVAMAASCVLLGARGVLIRGASGSGKSTLAWSLIREPRPFAFARLVCDDQVLVEAQDGRLLASPVAAIAGRIEIRGLGIVPLAHEPLARIGLLADLTPANDIPRLPQPDDLRSELLGVALPRLAVPMRNPLAAALVLHAMSHLAAGGDLADFSGDDVRV
ncbi:MAG: HPr kinase/phosphatase C-terminal domain-containing protein [Hyphomicrobiales bacterium]|jgi:serine kinase of HPr protein (carbohydrate metabolism regulator)|nr:HPr kinase/phosphatase C-terminal domain-containing protein [Hyphomicrobiales bacterium]